MQSRWGKKGHVKKTRRPPNQKEQTQRKERDLIIFILYIYFQKTLLEVWSDESVDSQKRLNDVELLIDGRTNVELSDLVSLPVVHL